jgi:hypothetical protein
MYFVSLTRSPFFDYRPVNHTGFPRRRMEPLSVIWVAADLPVEKRMAQPRFASPHPRFHEWAPKDRQPLTLLRRLMIEIEDSIAQSRAVILSTRDAIELLERLEGRQFSN